jgi:hypothetical protein
MSTIFGNDLFSSPRAAAGGLRVELFTASQCGAARRRRHALMRMPARRIVPGLGVAVARLVSPWQNTLGTDGPPCGPGDRQGPCDEISKRRPAPGHEHFG